METKTQPRKSKQTQQNYPGLVAFYNTQPGNEVGLFYMLLSTHGAIVQGSCDKTTFSEWMLTLQITDLSLAPLCQYYLHPLHLLQTAL